MKTLSKNDLYQDKSRYKALRRICWAHQHNYNFKLFCDKKLVSICLVNSLHREIASKAAPARQNIYEYLCGAQF